MATDADPINRRLRNGSVVSGYDVRRIQHVTDIDVTFYELSHVRTGARHIHLSCPDRENTFGVAFRTVPQDATGVAHILEHTVLCGSGRYPVRDPFFSMLKRSLSTFMNAFTASDWTMYPFSTQNRKDFYNLLDVYLDAAFFPRLDELSFKQEGHRLEFENRNGADDRLVYKGVVYNEMKGAMSSPDQVMVRSIQNALFPDTTYRFNSGGDPGVIPKLTHEDLVAFHRRHYHPSNAYFYTYGNLPLEAHLEHIDAHVLDRFDRISPGTEVSPQRRWQRPRTAEYTYPISRTEDASRKYQTCLAWLTADIQDAFGVLVLSLLERILIGNPASPLRKALIESNLGSALSDGTGYADEYRDTLFAAGLKEISADDAPAVESLVMEVLHDLAGNGVDPELVASALHQLEFHRKEKTNHPYPYGLKLLMWFAGNWIHGGDPLRSLQFDADLNRIRKETAAGRFFEDRIRSSFIDNPHRVRLTLVPDVEMTERHVQETEAELAAVIQQLDPAAIQKIKEDTAALKARQDETEDITVLPTLELVDVPPTVHRVPPSGDLPDLSTTLYEQPTGGIFYLTAALPVGHLAPNLLPLIPFFCYALPKIGTTATSYVEMARTIDRYTGGIGLSVTARTGFGPEGRCLPFVSVNGKCLDRNIERMVDILAELMAAADFTDHQRLGILLAEYRSGLESMVVHSGHRLAISLAARHLSTAGTLNEMWGGIHQLRFVKEITREPRPETLASVGERMTAIRDRFQSDRRMQAAFIGEASALDTAAPLTGRLLLKAAIPGPDRFPEPSVDRATERTFEGWQTSTAVSFVARATATVRMDRPEAPALSVISKMMRSLFLHREIREKGGAYGGFATYSPEDGLFCLASYRDPHIVRTLQVFDRAIDAIASGAFTDDDIREAVLQVCSDIDKPDTPGPAARKAFYRTIVGLDDESRQRFKQRLLALTRDQVLTAAGHLSGAHAVAVISSEAQLAAANEALEAPLDIHAI